MSLLSTHVAVTARPKFYVDATGGSDASNGRTPATAWQTGAKVNSASLPAGSRVLFKRGETFTLGASIALQSFVTYAAYGSGAKPVLDGQDLYNVFYTNGKTVITLKDLDLRNGYDFCAYFTNCTYVRVIDCDMNRAGNDCLNFFAGCHHCLVSGGVYQNAYERVAGPAPTGIEVTDGAHDILIKDVECTANNYSGITIHSHPTTDMPYNVTVRNANCHANTQFGIVIFNQNGTAGKGADLNIRIYDSSFNTNTLDGIRVTKAAAITEYPADILFEGCVAKDNTRYACWNEGDDVTYQRCIFHEGRMFYSRNSVGLKVYNCTFFLTTWAGYRPFTHDDAAAPQVRGDTTIELKNNIICMPDTAGSSIIGVLAGATSGATIDYTIYQSNASSARWSWSGTSYTFANWKTNSSQDANSSVTADAAFTDPGNDDFTLQAASPAVDAGVEIVGVTEGYLGDAPDCGYAEKA